MADRTKWKPELDSMGMAAVQKKLDHAGAGHGSIVPGFKCGNIERGFVEDWIAAKEREATNLQAATLLWAKIAAVIGVVVTIVVPFLTKP
jgi:hypothetical protein